MKKLRTVVLWLLLVVAVMFLVWQQQSQQPKLTMSFAEFLSDVGA